jgi:hypothetical protein
MNYKLFCIPLKNYMFNTTKNINLEFATVQNSRSRRVVVNNSTNNLSLDIILGISIIISVLGIIILG